MITPWTPLQALAYLAVMSPLLYLTITAYLTSH